MIDVNTLGAALGKIHGRWPDAQIGVNDVGNLIVSVDGQGVGWIDIGVIRPGTGAVNLFETGEVL